MDIIDYDENFVGHWVNVSVKGASSKRLFIMDIDYADDNNDEEDEIVYYSGDGVALDGTSIDYGVGIPIKDITSIELSDS